MTRTVMLKNRRQLAARIEATEGTLETLTFAEAGTHDGRLRVENPRWRKIPTMAARDHARPSFTPLPMVPGGFGVEMSFGVELAGHQTNNTTEPELSKLLRACGFHYTSLRSLSTGTITGGPIEHGEALIQATTGATALACGDLATSGTLRYQLLTTGTNFGTSNVVTGQRSGATFTPSALFNGGALNAQAWWPVAFQTTVLTLSASSAGLAVGATITGGTSAATGELVYSALTSSSVLAIVRVISGTFTAGGESLSGDGGWTGTSSAAAKADSPSLTLSMYCDGEIVTAIGCRGNVSFGLSANGKTMLEFTFQGIHSSTAYGANFDCINYKAQKPPVWKAATVTLDGAAVTGLLLNSIGIEIGNQVALRDSATDTEGLAPAQILGRRVGITMSPDALRSAQYAWSTKLHAGTVIKLVAVLGSATPNIFTFTCEKMQIEDIGDGDRGAVSTHDIRAFASSGTYGTSDAREGRDNDLIILNT